MEFHHLSQLLAHHWGTWICQRTRFYLDGTPANHGKAQLEITGLSPDHAPPPLGILLTWHENNRPVGSTTLTFDLDSPQFSQNHRADTSQGGHYTWSKTGVLELTLPLLSGQKVVERLWFASANLRLRTVRVRGANGLESVAFYSDIRRVTPS
ncbi:hypothetical protein GlitD10_1697 [Gloeomargarita lithophora Alchichica-D10]|uniref:Chromophore lyase CpcS/CpeS n=1 Tax=Gloeomargarita lithophora Alchichica-D10 TaxID=1188229 RepID=A0A1J0ADJ9_9CYAN|nr:phycobiliprotein lyase [Gloeomargarita lithophora]APB34022.1 hypothetical protein GlitD10_1697 [Gloeomargarita lithophora Alchichica-D10]